MSQPTAEKKKWPRHFLALAQETHPEYSLNREMRGTRTECLRIADDSLIHSQNTICIRGQYYHCFAVLISSAKTPYLSGPFVAGGRFNHNFVIADGFTNDLLLPPSHPDRPQGVHSTHQWRKGTDDIVRHCVRNAEIHLAPYYRALVRRARGELLALLNTAQKWMAQPDNTLTMSPYADAVAELTDVSLKELVDPASRWFGVPQEIRYQSAIAACPDYFASYNEHYDSMIDVLNQLDANT